MTAYYSLDYDYSSSTGYEPEPRLEPDDEWYDDHYPDTGQGTGLYRYNEDTDQYEEILAM